MKTAFEEIYDAYHHDLYRFVFYMVKNKQITEDLVQEVYIRVINSYDTFKGESSQKTWLFSIARHVTIDYFRSQKRRRKRILDYFDWPSKGKNLEDDLPLPEDLVLQDEQVKEIYKHLDECTEDQRSVLILRFLHEFSIKETAEALNFSESKVKTTQHRALKKLRALVTVDVRRGLHEK